MLSRQVNELENENARLKEEIEIIKARFDEEQPKPKACEYCKFYLQHYIKADGHYMQTYCGHCTHGRCKDRKPKDSCKYFEVGTYSIRNFV